MTRNQIVMSLTCQIDVIIMVNIINVFTSFTVKPCLSSLRQLSW